MLEEIVPKEIIELEEHDYPFVCRTAESRYLDSVFGFDIYRKHVEEPANNPIRGNGWKDGHIRLMLNKIAVNPSDSLNGKIRYHVSGLLKRNFRIALEAIEDDGQRLAASYLCVRAVQMAGFVALPLESMLFQEFAQRDIELASRNGLMRRSLVRYNDSLVQVIELTRGFSYEAHLLPYIGLAQALMLTGPKFV